MRTYVIKHRHWLVFLCQLCVRIIAVFLLNNGALIATPISTNDAVAAVQGWLQQDRRPLGKNLSPKIKRTETVKDAAGKVIYHTVHLDPAGYVIVAGDDTIEPFIAFSTKGDFDTSAKKGLAAWLNRDFQNRTKRLQAGIVGNPEVKAHGKWRSALAASPNPPPDLETNGYIVLASQIWVAPFVQTLWDQQTDVSGNYACFNYYTPPFGAGNSNNYCSGCVATAMAQTLYYFQYPTNRVGTGAFTYQIYNTKYTGNLRGGDGNGGPYQWTNMPLAPNNPTLIQAQAIGALCYDAGLTVNMQYEDNADGGSGADDTLIRTALTGTFQYGNAVLGANNNGIAVTNLIAMINPNLDARLPVILGIETAGGDGHEIVCDGYGYSGSTLFHHLNMGWSGADDIWYALPNIDTPDASSNYTLVTDCTYNIFTNGSGPIISGRVTDPTGAPVVGASVFATSTTGTNMSTITDTNGIYAVTHLSPNTPYTVIVTNSGYIPASNNYTTGLPKNGTEKTGNVWGGNFTMTTPLLAMPENGFAAIGPIGGPFNVSSQTYVLTNSTVSAANWAASGSPAWLSISPSNGMVAAKSASNFSISLSAAAASLGTGSNSATIWITNLTTGLAQSLQFSLTVKTADYPIAVSGYNDDVVVENTAVGGNTAPYADTFDLTNSYFSPPTMCFYQQGLPAINVASNNVPSVQGLPQSGFFTSAVDGATTFQLGPYAGYNVLALSSGNTSGTLSLAAPLPYKSLAVLAATAEGGGNGTLVLNFMDGTSSSPISFNATNYFTVTTPSSGAALSRFGIIFSASFNQYNVWEAAKHYPTLYQTSINLASLGLHTKPVNSITFTMPGGLSTNAVTGVFALSGTQSPYPMITSQPQSVSIGVGNNTTFSVGVSGGAPLAYRWLLNGVVLSGGQTNPVITVNAGATNAGNYQVIATNFSGAVTSSVATLSITNLPVKFVTTGNTNHYSNGRFILQLSNLAGQGAVVIYASTNLSQWVPIFTNPSGFGSFNFTDATVSQFPHRYYRATTP